MVLSKLRAPQDLYQKGEGLGKGGGGGSVLNKEL